MTAPQLCRGPDPNVCAYHTDTEACGLRCLYPATPDPYRDPPPHVIVIDGIEWKWDGTDDEALEAYDKTPEAKYALLDAEKARWRAKIRSINFAKVKGGNRK